MSSSMLLSALGCSLLETSKFSCEVLCSVKEEKLPGEGIFEAGLLDQWGDIYTHPSLSIDTPGIFEAAIAFLKVCVCGGGREREREKERERERERKREVK